MRFGELRIARGHQHLRTAWTETGWQQQNVDCLLLYRPRLVRDQTPNTRRPRKPGSLSRKDRSTLPIISKSMLLASTRDPTMYIGGTPSPSPSPGPQSPAQSHVTVGRAKEKKKTSSQDGF